MFFDFILDSMGELINQIAKMQYMSSGRLKMPLILRGILALVVQRRRIIREIIIRCSPTYRVLGWCCRSNCYDAKGLFKTALVWMIRSFFWNMSRFVEYQDACAGGKIFIPFGQAAVVREGTAATVVALGTMVRKTQDAADILAKENMNIEIY